MWKLIMRGERGTPFTDVGQYASLADVTKAILKIENANCNGNDFALFLRVWVSPYDEPNDADVLSNFIYQGKKRFYEVSRAAH